MHVVVVLIIYNTFELPVTQDNTYMKVVIMQYDQIQP